MAQELEWEYSCDELHEKRHEVLVILLWLIEGVNYQIVAELKNLWEGSGRGVGESVLFGVSNTLKELSILASVNVVVSIDVHLLSNILKNILALRV
jgi:hypothetical protein